MERIFFWKSYSKQLKYNGIKVFQMMMKLYFEECVFGLSWLWRIIWLVCDFAEYRSFYIFFSALYA